MNYKSVQPHTKEEAEAAFAQGAREQIIDALLGVTYYEEDWRWVQKACLTLLDGPDPHLQWVAIQCLGHLATFHHTLDMALVLPALLTHTSDQYLTAPLLNAFDDLATGIEETSYFEEHWETLPQRMKNELIIRGTLNSFGKRLRKRNFLSRREGMMPEEGSRDQEVVERLKHRYVASSSHEWNEYYDEQGNLLRLSLANLGLTQLPPELWKLASLLELDLSENQLGRLPPEFGQLQNLENLTLSENTFVDLPPVLERLMHLQELDLDTNQLKSISASIGQLSSLHTLSVGGNQLSSIPAEIGKLMNLVVLYLQSNQLESIPPEIGKLQNLRTLFLEENQLRNVPPEVGKLQNLRTLFLQDNQLRNVPAELGQLVNLDWLILRGNQLSSVPAELGQLVKLDVFDLSQNTLLQNPPPEVIQQGVPAILAYLQAL